MSGLIFHLIPHTHWDREWYLPRAAFQARLLPALDDLIERLQTDAGYKSFLLDGQTVLVADYLNARPERKADLQTLVKTGRLQVGPWYVLADELIPSGEALVRNLLLGAADADQLGGRLDVLYSPDAFGHPAAWPTLAREFGIRCGVVWRGLGGEPGQERDLYRWRGPDGRGVPVGHLQLVGEGVKPSPLDGELRWSYRYAWTLQGVHATRAPLKRRATAAELCLERLAEPLAALARRAGGRDRRPLLEMAWRTLVRCQFHDAIAGCTSDDVARAVAGRLTSVEALAGDVVRGAVLDLVRHDPDAARERAGDPAPALVMWNPAARPRGGVVVVGVALFRRDVLVGPPSGRVPRQGQGYRPFGLAGPDGRPIALQLLDRRPGHERLDAARHYPDQDEVDRVRVALRLPAVPGLGVRCAALTPGATRPDRAGDGAVVKGRSLVNHWIEIVLEPTGALALHDRRTGERFFDVLRLEDGGDAGDTYSYCPPVRDRSVRAAGPIKVRRLAAGPLVASLEATFTMRVGDGVTEQRRANSVTRRRPGQVEVRFVVMLHADSPVVRCIIDIDNQATWHRLRARVPTQLAGVPAVAGAPFGSVARLPVVARAADYPPATPVRTAPAHRFVAAADGRRGVALLAPGFFEYQWTRHGDLVLTLLRSVGELSRGDLPTRPGHAGWPIATPLAQCLGTSRVELAIVPVSHAEVERGDVIPSLWEDVFLPVRGFWLRDAGELVSPPIDIALEGTGLVMSAVKPAQQGSPMVLRCYNGTGRRVQGAWRFGEGVKSAHRVRADERESTALVLEGRGKTVRFVAEPHEIVTILVT